MAKRIYDVTINGQGYMLAPGKSSYMMNIATPWAPKSVTGDYTLSDFEEYSIAAQSDFRGGAGQLRLDDSTKFLWAHRIDSRGERVTLGVPLDTSQPTSDETSGTVGVWDANGQPLNVAFSQDTEDVATAWQTLDGGTTKIAVKFTAPGGATFAPTDISGLKLWLKADAGTFEDSAGSTAAADADDPIGRWADQSGTGNHFTQATAGSRPTLKLNQQNSLPTIKGDGSADFLAGSAPVTGSGARTIFVVLKGTAAGADEFYLDLGNYGAGTATGEDFAIANTATNKLRIYCNNGNRIWTTGLGVAAYRILAITLSGTTTNTLTAHVDGAALTVDTTLNATVNTGNDAGLFRRTDTTDRAAAYIGEVIVYDSALSSTDRQAVESYLAARWDLSVAGASTFTIDKIWAYIRSTTGVGGSTVNYAIFSDSSDAPNAAITNGTTANIVASRVTAGGEWLDLAFATSPSVTAGTAYWLVVNFTSVGGQSLDVLTGYGLSTDEAKTYNGSAWSDITTDYTAAIFGQFVNSYPSTPPVKFVEFQGGGAQPYVYALAGKRLYRMLTATTMIAAADGSGTKVLGADGEDMLVVQKKADTAPKLLIALGTGSDAIVYDGATTWTAVSGSIKAQRLCLHDNKYWRASDDTTSGCFVQGTSDYADWTTAGTGGEKVQVGDRRYTVRALFSWRGNLFAGKQDGLYAITYGDTYPAAGVIPQANKVLDFSSEIHSNTFNAFCIFQDDLYFSLANGLARYSASGVISSVSPEVGLLEQTAQRGMFTALTGTLGQLYAVMQGNAEDWTQYLSYAGSGWHIIATSDRLGDQCKAMFVDSGTYSELPRVWTSSGPTICSFIQPTWTTRRWTYATGAATSEVRFWHKDTTVLGANSGRLYSSWIDANLQNIVKNWVSIDIVSANLHATNQYITVYYRDDEEDSWTSLGNVTTEPVQQLTFTAGTTSRKLQLRFDLTSLLAYESPHFLGYALRYVPLPDVHERYQLQLLLAPDTLLHNGAKESRTAKTQYDALVTARDTKSTITFVDIWGTSHTVHMNQLNAQLFDFMEINDTTIGPGFIAMVGLIEAV